MKYLQKQKIDRIHSLISLFLIRIQVNIQKFDNQRIYQFSLASQFYLPIIISFPLIPM